MLVLLHLMVISFLPALASRTVPFRYHEVCIKQQNDIIFHLLLIQRNSDRLCSFIVQRVRKESWLDHRQTINNRLAIKSDPLEERFIQTDAKSVDKVTSTKVET